MVNRNFSPQKKPGFAPFFYYNQFSGNYASALVQKVNYCTASLSSGISTAFLSYCFWIVVRLKNQK